MGDYSERKKWFEIIKHKDYLYVIRERLDEIDPRFYTTYDNLFLIIGSHSALLIDTGCGLFPLKPILNEIIKDNTLIVINTHSHWDHILGNAEFDEIIIHNEELKSISIPTDVSFLQDSPREIVKRYESNKYSIPPANNFKSIKDLEIIELGEVSVKVIHTPGHSPGSISLLTNNNELFTGDTAHYGTMYISKEEFPTHLASLSRLINLFQENKNIEIYPSHEEYVVSKDLLTDLSNGIQNIENIWDTKVRDDFTEGWLLSDENFKYLVF
ncbi:MAG: MBL fold metallo-hydrolase [Promethearchaeota archaeon]|jgi:glyoxylase-like metal-dependent hydrolase (beta-lactamase superfamily II)